MLISPTRRSRQLTALTVALSLAACTQRPLPAATAETSALTGKIMQGIVVAIRPIHTGPHDNTAGALNAVLLALAQPPVNELIMANEIVVQRDTKSAVSLTSKTVNVSVGDPVSIVEAGTTSIHRD